MSYSQSTIVSIYFCLLYFLWHMYALIFLSSLQHYEEAKNNQHGFFFSWWVRAKRTFCLDADTDAREQTASFLKVNVLLEAPFLRATMYSLFFQYKEIFWWCDVSGKVPTLTPHLTETFYCAVIHCIVTHRYVMGLPMKWTGINLS